MSSVISSDTEGKLPILRIETREKIINLIGQILIRMSKYNNYSTKAVMINNILKMTQSFNGYNTGIISPTNAEMKKYGFNTGISFGKAILFNFNRPVRDYTLNEFQINDYQINAYHLK